MKQWFHTQEDLKELFPVENLPLEILGNDRHDALSMLYQKRKESGTKNRSQRFPVHDAGIERQKIVFFRKIFPILDGFNSIFRYAGSQDIQGDEILSNWLQTLEALYRRLLSALEKEGLVAIESIGKPLDLSTQEVIETREDSSVPNNRVIEEVAKGYKYGNRVLRDAQVIVAKNPENSIGYLAAPEENNTDFNYPPNNGDNPKENPS